MPRLRGKGRSAAYDGRNRQQNARGSLKSAWAEGNYVQEEHGSGESEGEEADQQQVHHLSVQHTCVCNNCLPLNGCAGTQYRALDAWEPASSLNQSSNKAAEPLLIYKRAGRAPVRGTGMRFCQ